MLEINSMLSNPNWPACPPQVGQNARSGALHGGGRVQRHAEKAQSLSRDLVWGHHATEFYSGNRCVDGPANSRMFLKRAGPNGYLKSAANSLENTDFPYIVPKPAKALVTPRTIQERTRP